MEKVTTYNEIINEWAGRIVERNDSTKTVLFMDSYYLTKDGKKDLKEKEVMYVVAINMYCFVVNLWSTGA